MESRISSVQNRVSDIMQQMQDRMDRLQRYDTGPENLQRLRTPGGDARRSGESPHTSGGQSSAGGSLTHRSQGGLRRAHPGNVRTVNAQPPGAGNGFGAELDRMIEAEAGRQAISPELIRAVVKAESGGRPDARSKAGALGLMQLMPGTARELDVNDPLNPRDNLRGGVQYLNQMAERYGDLDLALAAYNAGPGAVKRYGGVPPYRETQDYIRKIRRELELDTAPEQGASQRTK